METFFRSGDLLRSKRFGWVYRIAIIRNGTAILEDTIKTEVRIKFSLDALRNRVKNDTFVHTPSPL